ncbi:MAG: hydrogenase maturation nickel metallochaperone HypA [Deltaproteobacteria bacterium HGW-Deltaproteobacteria-20]|nr:MAG: hydrogenase maturation nickel metallochaperone HypA [Deltaproteobacteria bacterium HGW-Deltaproteobacteria-20]
MDAIPAPPYTRTVHELSIAQSILDTVLEQAAEHGATRVTRVHLRVGRLTAVVKEALEMAFEALARDTVAQDARMTVDSVPWRARCSACSHEYLVEDDLPTCPRCGHLGGETIAGRELQIVEMDVE